MVPNQGTWICDKERAIIDSPFMKIIEQDCHSSDDERRHKFYVMRTRDFANIIPVTADGKVVLVKQHRAGINAHTVEVPGGLVDGADENAKASALREMTEETGYAPLPGARCEAILAPYSNPAILNNRCHSFIVGPVAKVQEQKLDPGEMIEVLEVPISEIPGMLLHGGIENALILTGLLTLALKTSEGSQALLRELTSYSRT